MAATSRILQLRDQLTKTTAMASQKPNLHLLSANTPNGVKVSILLEELGLPYTLTPISLFKDQQKEPWFLEINPNGRIPALTDDFEDGNSIRLFESGSIMQYLVDRYDKDHKLSYPHGTREYYETNNWLFWQMGGLGPMQGQANHFTRYAPGKIEYGINRYKNETRRLYRVLNTHLEKAPHGFIVGDRVTIADIACWGWIGSASWAGVDITEFPKVQEWHAKLAAREAFQKGNNVPPKTGSKKKVEDMTEEELEKMAAESRKWVQAGMASDAKA